MTQQTDHIQHRSPRSVLVVGAYGLIGAGIARALIRRGHSVKGLGRDADTAHRVLPAVDWVIRDLRDMTAAADWTGLLEGVDMVVNAAGVLQETGRDNLRAVQVKAVLGLADACAGSGVGLVQISAAGAEQDAATPFLATKAEADAAILNGGAPCWIFRPGLVVAQNAYGGTSLIRMLAAMPMIQPVAMARAQVHTIGLPDLAEAVALAVEGRLPPGLACDLVEDAPHELSAIVRQHREWLGLGPGRQIEVPSWVLGPVAALADGLGRLGWRSPLRSTAAQVLSDGIRGDPEPWQAASGKRIASLPETLAQLEATVEHRLAARMALMLPVVVAVLSAFWLLSGLIGFLRVGQAAEVLTATGWPEAAAVSSVLFWSVVDLLLGGAVLIRNWARRAALGMVAVSLIYLGAATVFTPGLWLDPLGPLVKVVPGAVLAIVAWMLLEER